MNRNAILTLAAAILAMGCATGGHSGAAPTLTQPADKRAAVVAGLNSVDPAHYGGWMGYLPDCEVDADIYGLMADGHGIPKVTLKTGKATRAAVFDAIRKAAKGMATNDLLFVAYSGHGGQIMDINGDEGDGKDETICLYDGNVSDDDVFALILTLPPCRIFLISDSCHSEGNFKAPPFVVARNTDRGVARWGGSILQFAGCREANTSASTGSGGRWTTALVDAYGTTGSNQTYRQWFNTALRLMPRDQVPVLVEYGASFADMEVFK